MKTQSANATTTKTRLFTNATLLTLISALERGLGFLYRIVLSRLLGAEGMGLYQVAVSIYHIFVTVGTGGLPITVSRFISKAKAKDDLDLERQAVGAGVALALLITMPIAGIGYSLPAGSHPAHTPGGSGYFLQRSRCRCFPVFR